MAYDPIQEDCLRLILEDMRRKKVFPLENPAVIEHDMHAYQEDPARLISSDADRSFHLMTRAAELIDYRTPFISDETEAARQDDVATGYLREATELDPSNWDAKRMLFAMEAPCNDAYVSYLLDNLPAIRSHTQRLIEDAHDPYDREYASDLGQRPYLRWLGAIASRALISGQYLLSLEHAEAALEIDPADQGDLRRTALLAMAKLEWGLEDIEGFTKHHALAFSLPRQAPRRGGRVAGPSRVDPWEALARASAQYRSFEFDAAEQTLGTLVKQYSHGAEALYYQAEFPEGVFARVNTLPGSEDELILAISEATPLLQEGYGSPDSASFATWVSDCDAVQEALDGSRAGARGTASRRAGGRELMEPREYLPAFLEHRYLQQHPDLTDAARELLHDEVGRRPERYAADDHARALIAYAQLRGRLLSELRDLEDTVDDDDEFERRRARLFGESRLAMHKIGEADRLCIDAQLVDIQLADVPLDDCLRDMMQLEARTRSWLEENEPGFDLEAPHYWRPEALEEGEDDAARTRRDPVMVGWLHALWAIAQGCLGTGRYRAAAGYARRVAQGAGFEDLARGTLLLSLARLENEEAFFAAAREGGEQVEDSPWYLLARTILLYKLGHRKNARRALRDFVGRCDGGAFFLLNPTYLAPYLPCRPATEEPWEATHQALWEADGIIVDTPDFATWASSVEGVEEASEHFAEQNGF